MTAMPLFLKTDEVFWSTENLLLISVSLSSWIMAHILSRRGHYRWGVLLAIISASIFIFSRVYLDFSLYKLNYILIPLLIGSVVLPASLMHIYLLANLIAMLFLAYLNPAVTMTQVLLGPVRLVGIGGILLMLLERQKEYLTQYRRARLIESEERYHNIFETSPISLWLEDFSAAKEYIDKLSASGIEDFQSYFEEHPDAVRHCAELVTIIDVNLASMELYGVTKKEKLLGNLSGFITEASYHGFIKELVAIAKGKTQITVNKSYQALKSGDKYLIVTWQVAPGYEETLSRCLVSIRDITEREKAAEALRESEKRYRVLFKNTGTALCVFGEDRIIRLCNQQFSELVGLPREKIEGKVPWSKFVTEQDLPTLELYHEQRTAGNGNPPTEYEFNFVDAQGKIKNIYLQLGFLAKTGERVVSLLDVTQLKQAQRALRESEDRFRSVVEQSTDGIALADEKGELIEWNAALEQISGLASKDMLGKALWETPLAITDQKQKLQDVFDTEHKNVAHQFEQVMEQEFIRLDGSRRTVLLSIFPLKTIKGLMLGSIVRDITKRKRMEEQLRESEERLRLIVEGTQALLINVSARGRIRQLNEAAVKKFAMRPEEIIGRLYLRWVHPEDRAWVSDVFQARIEAGATSASTPLEFRIVTGNGNVRWLNFVAHPILAEGQIVEIVGFALDITERNQAEQELQEYREQLEELVAERTAKLRQLVDLMAGREVRMAELKNVIRELHAQLEYAGLEPVAEDPLLGTSSQTASQ